MACSEDYIEYVCSQIGKYGLVTFRKMFGEYMIYINGKPILLVTDNVAHVKMLPEVEEYMKDSETAHPYDGAKLHYVLDIEDEHVLSKVIPILDEITPLPKPKKKKVKI